MKRKLYSSLALPAGLVGFVLLVSFSGADYRPVSSEFKNFFPADTNDPDSNLPYPFENQTGGLYGNNPSNYKETVEYDPESGQYIITQKIGDLVAKPPVFMTAEEYSDYVKTKQATEYFEVKTQNEEVAKAQGREAEKSLIPQITINSELFNKIFGSNTIDIRPQGYAELRFGGRIQNIDNPLIPERSRSTFTFDFDQRIQINVNGKIGENMNLKFSYDTEATFAFENQQKLEYNGQEDDIVKKIELGNVSLPLNSSLISGAQSLFGVKGQFQFGRLTLTSVFSQQQSQSSSINVQGGAVTTDFEIWGDQYEANRHYFLSHYFRDNYENFLANMPLITSPAQITKVEVWVTNTRQATENTRNIVAFMDLGERNNSSAYRNTSANRPGPDIFSGQNSDRFPDNGNNALDPRDLQGDYPGVRSIGQVNSVLNGAGFEEAIEYTDLNNARRLQGQEFEFHPQLGYISLNTALNQDEVLAVSFQFTAGGKTYQVGEFSTDGVQPPNALVVKMLKSPILNVRAPMWDLMMKNVYSLNAFQVNPEDFRLNILYRDDETGTPVPFLPDGELQDQLLLRVVELDRLNTNNDPQPDGFFDFVPGITIKPQRGRIFFPVLEPFGSTLADKLSDPENRDKYVFQQLYDSTKFVAQNETELNKYMLQGQYKSSSSSEISLNAFNIPQGSVTVTAGGAQLVENVDYTVDYNLGRVKILNEGILQSGQPIKVDFENNALFNFQTKTFMGLNADYRFNDHLNVGGTVVRLSERPLTQKVNIGDEPIANTMIGMNANYSKDAPYLTRFVDAIPFIETKESSNLTASGEVVTFIPGTPRGIKIEDEATTYLDDFESSQTTVDIKNPTAWRLASTPGGQPTLFPESSRSDLSYGYNRARLAWYNIDPLFHRNDGRTPDNIQEDKDLQSLPYIRQVLVNEVFPNIQQQPSDPRNIATLDLSFFPNERGPYNFDVEPTDVSDGLNADGSLKNPSSRWGGIMRDMTTTNFEEQNIEFVQFWVMDPYFGNPEAPNNAGDLYLNLGSVSEDILRDGQQAVENGIPAEPDSSKLNQTHWGFVPKVRPNVVAFDNDNDVRSRQDVGYDLLSTDEERAYTDGTYLPYVQRVENEHGQASGAYTQANNDPGADNFQYYQGSGLDQEDANILRRYKFWNNPENNSNPNQVNGVVAFATNQPDIEDINRDQTLSKTETYYQYRVSMRQGDLQTIGRNYITDILETTSPQQPNGETYPVRWIQFKVPVFSPDKKVGPIGDFRSIRFMRMFMRSFSEAAVLRFARLELVRGEWRRYNFNLDAFGDELGTDRGDETVFEVNAVNIEQNGTRSPVPYVIPPGIERQVLFGTTAATQQNEQSLSMRVCNLKDGAARAVFRNINFDMRLYNRLKMFVHAEDGDLSDDLQDGDLTVFIRMGSDYNQNYYEYQLPLKVTPFGSNEDFEIWPDENSIDLDLNDLKEAKLSRDREYRSNGNTNIQPFSQTLGQGTITIKGAPNLGNVRTFMIGVRNPKKRLADDEDDGMAKCAEVWVNELRLTDFDQRGGWAANARVAAQLADFGNVSLSGRMSTVGFGSLDQSVSERQKENIYAYDFQSSYELGKFFSKDFGLRVPMFFSISEEWRNPQFSPLDPDIEFDQALENLETQEEQKELKKISQDYTKRRSLNFTNVRKERTSGGRGGEGGGSQKTPKPWDIENFSASYSFNETFRRNINTVYDSLVQYRGNLNYSYRTNPVPVEPFKNVGFMSSEYWNFVRDFNFNWLPRQFTVIGTLDRSIHRVQQRNPAQFENPVYDFELPKTENNNFNFNRQYSLLWDLTRTLKFDFNANMRTRIDEPTGIDSSLGTPYRTYTKEARRDSIWENLKNFGRPTNYHQTANINWQVPINKLPFLSFVNSTAQYTADYDWAANSLQAQGRNVPDSLKFGNTIQNSSRIQFNNNLNFVGFYNQIPYLKKVNTPGGGKQRANRLRRPERQRPGSETEDGEDEEEEDEETAFDKIMAGFARTLMMVRSASANYSLNRSVALPGFEPTASILGMDDSQGWAPGFDFVAGSQDVDALLDRSASNAWITESQLQPNPYRTTRTEAMTFRVTAEPINNFRIVLTAQRNTSRNFQEFFRYNDTIFGPNGEAGYWQRQNPFLTENFSMSYFTMATAFENLSAPDYSSDAYAKFLENRLAVSERLADQYAAQNPDYEKILNPNTDSANYGYNYFSVNSQDVLIPAFLAAYSGKNINGFDLNPKRKIPLPNWQVTYDGLNKMKWAQKLFSSAVLNHAYRSTYTVSNITTNLLRQQALQDSANAVPLNFNGDLLPENQINGIVISEQFAPLIGINVKLKNSATLRVEYKKDRNLNLSLTNAQVTETKGKEWVIGVGYIIKDVPLKFVRLGPRRTSPVSNLELKADLSIRDNITVIRRIVEETEQVTAGQKIIGGKFSADYQISERVTAKLFYDLNLSRFKISNAYPITTHQFGIAVRLNLGQ